jgi:hypothetical protein
MTNAPSESEGVRRPYTGSCHCGFTKYIIYLTFPPTLLSGQTSTVIAKQHKSIRLRKCNCTVCHKMFVSPKPVKITGINSRGRGFFHVRVHDPAEAFTLLSPLDPLKELSDYTCGDGDIHFFFCGKCGVRCFAFCGEGEIVERDIDGDEKKKVWKPVHGNDETGVRYLSVNAQTLDAGQEGLDLREWYDKKWVCYLDMLDEEGSHSFERPHRGGSF